VYSVCIDENRESWITASREDGIFWPCSTFDPGGWNAASALAYDIHYTPKYFLIDGEGEILDTYPDINNLDKQLTEMLDKRQSLP